MWEDGTTNYAVDLKAEVSKTLTIVVPHTAAMTSYSSNYDYDFSAPTLAFMSPLISNILNLGDVVELSFL